MLVSDFVVNSRLKILNGIVMDSWNVLMRMQKKGHFLYIGGRAVPIATSAKLLDTKYEFVRFSDDLRGTIN